MLRPSATLRKRIQGQFLPFSLFAAFHTQCLAPLFAWFALMSG